MPLLRLLQQIAHKNPRLLILGLDNAGKTTALKKLADDANPEETEPTKGFNVKSIIHGGCKLDVWDIGGHETIRGFWNNYLEKTDCLVYVVDSTDEKRMEQAGTELFKLMAEAQLAGVPVLIFANKQDLETAADPDEIAGLLNLPSIKDRPWKIQKCSAKFGDGLEEGINWVTSMVAAK